MTQRSGTLHLNAFLMTVGHHEAAWRLPESEPFAATSVEHYKKLARIAERGQLDSLFLADSPVLWNSIGRRPAGTLEPTVLLTALAGATEHIGLIATASTTYNEPFNLVRVRRPRERGPRRVEHRHDRGRRGRPQLQLGRTARARRPLRARRRVRASLAEALGQRVKRASAFYADLKARARALGRDPDTIKILPRIVPVLGSTEKEAKELEAKLDSLIKPEYAKRQLAETLRVRPEALELDRELPASLPSEDEIEGAKSRYTLIVNLARREHLTVRQLIGRLGGGRGHRTFSGTPEQVADALQDWWENGAADGFNVMPPVLPSGLETFVDCVVPLLQRRGLFRTEYTGKTLRDNYGLPRPPNRNETARALEGAA